MPNSPMVSFDTPISAGTEPSKQPGTVQKSSDSRKEPLAFKKKLEDCIKVDETPYGNPSAPVNQTNGNTQDNSMAANLTDAKAETQVVGILEGFGMLDYQSNLPLVSPQDGQATDNTTVGTAVDTLLQGLTQNPEQTGALEKYARMLSKDQLMKLPVEMQQAIAKAVGDYLGSFESTNNNPVKETAPTAVGTMPVNAQASEAAQDISALPDKIASLLIKLKTVQQDVKQPVGQSAKTPSLEATAAPVIPQPDAAAVKPDTATAKPDSVSPITVQTVQPEPEQATAGKQPAQDVKSEIKTPAPEMPAAQTQRTDAPLNLQPVSTAQTEAPTDQPAKAQQNTGADFVKDNVMRIVDKMSSQTADGKTDFDVELKPEFLGKVNIKLSMQNGEIRMQIKTDDMNVKSMFADQVSSMQAVFKDKGIAVTNIDITYQSQMQTGEDHRSFNQSGNSKKQSGRGHISLEKVTGTGVFEKMTQISGYTHGGSSVEYLA